MSDQPIKPTVRVRAGSEKSFIDGYQNFAAGLGYGAVNLLSGSTYGFEPLSRNRYKLEMMYRGSWLARQIVDSVAEDMTRAGIVIDSDMTPERESELMEEWQALQSWQHIQSAIKWARLYGGAVAVIMIEGHDPATPLDINQVTRGSFKGLQIFDRWMLQPSLEEPIRKLGPEFGLPRFYDVVSDAHSVPGMKIHHSRVIRLEGVDLPYWQKMSENYWGLSVLEPMMDRMMAFDSATTGAAQLVYKAHLRTLSVDGLRNLIAGGGKAYEAFRQQVNLIRLMQSNEGMTILDKTDEFQTHQYGFAGLSEVLINFGQQLSGAAQIPLVRLFGQSPAGLNATGDSDLRNYYDMINAQQEAKLRRPLTILFEIMHRHKFGTPLPNGFGFSFRPLWQLQESEKAQAAAQNTNTALTAFEAAVVGRKTVLKELKEQSRITGFWTNITDEQIEQAEEEPPNPLMQMGGGGMGMPGGEMGGMPGAEGDPSQPPGEAPTALSGQPGAQGPDPNVIPFPRAHKAAQGAGAGDSVRSRVMGLFPHIAGRRDAVQAQPVRKLDSVHALFGHRHNPDKAARIKHVLGLDQRAIVEIHGIPCVIETARGERREGIGWSHVMAHDYGYIMGTASPEHGGEQMDCYIGPNPTADMAYIVHQHKADGGFDEYKVMLGFPSIQHATNAYYQAFADGSGPQRLHRIDALSIAAFKDWIAQWPYDLSNHEGDGPPPRHTGTRA